VLQVALRSFPLGAWYTEENESKKEQHNDKGRFLFLVWGTDVLSNCLALSFAASGPQDLRMFP
jgi:hypothetical protein